MCVLRDRQKQFYVAHNRGLRANCAATKAGGACSLQAARGPARIHLAAPPAAAAALSSTRLAGSLRSRNVPSHSTGLAGRSLLRGARRGEKRGCARVKRRRRRGFGAARCRPRRQPRTRAAPCPAAAAAPQSGPGRCEWAGWTHLPWVQALQQQSAPGHSAEEGVERALSEQRQSAKKKECRKERRSSLTSSGDTSMSAAARTGVRGDGVWFVH